MNARTLLTLLCACSAEERAKASEHERHKAEASRQSALKETARLQVALEERVAEVERAAADEQQKR
jgi:hypothetical protein